LIGGKTWFNVVGKRAKTYKKQTGRAAKRPKPVEESNKACKNQAFAGTRSW
jgi:hypothetical protein